MSHDCTPPEEGIRVWTTSEGTHLDVRGLDCPEPMVRVLGMIDRGEGGNVLIVHINQEPVFLYPELADRGWTYEVVPQCGHHSSEEGVMVRLVRLCA
jgi:TusA-related sulfurtransferase